MPVKLVFLNASDIATFVGEGDVDLGITGQDLIMESGMKVEELLELGIGKCKLCVEAPYKEDGTLPSLKDLAGERIVTSFTHISENFFKDALKGSKQPTFKHMNGSVEASCSLGTCLCVCWMECLCIGGY